MTLNLLTGFETITCCHAGCGIVFAVPSWWESKRRDDHTVWYCPNGHEQHFNSASATELLRKALVAKDAQLDQVRAARARAERRAAAARGQVTKIRNRIANGVCPCCNRSFQNLRRHMATKHPHYDHPFAS